MGLAYEQYMAYMEITMPLEMDRKVKVLLALAEDPYDTELRVAFAEANERMDEVKRMRRELQENRKSAKEEDARVQAMRYAQEDNRP